MSYLDPVAFRAAFVRRLTTDSKTRSPQHKAYHQAIFAPATDGGFQVWTKVDLEMVLSCFDAAVLDLQHPERLERLELRR